MKREKTKFCLTAAAAVLALTSQLSFAATLRASSTLDWNELVVSFIPDSLSATHSEELTFANNCGFTLCSDAVDAADWTTPILSGIASPLLDASAAADATSITTSVDLHGDISTLLSLQIRGGDFLNYSHSSNVQRSGVFHVAGGSGFMLVAIPATVSAEVVGWDVVSSAFAQASATIILSKDNGAFSEGDLSRSVSSCLDCGFVNNGSVSDIIVAALRVNAGEDVFFSAQSSSVVETSQFSPVPLPAGVWLLASALGGLAAMRRRPI